MILNCCYPFPPKYPSGVLENAPVYSEPRSLNNKPGWLSGWVMAAWVMAAAAFRGQALSNKLQEAQTRFQVFSMSFPVSGTLNFLLYESVKALKGASSDWYRPLNTKAEDNQRGHGICQQLKCTHSKPSIVRKPDYVCREPYNEYRKQDEAKEKVRDAEA